MEALHDIWLLLDVLHKASAAGPEHSWITALVRTELAAIKAAQDGPKAIPNTTTEEDTNG
jgi:hypothetical protein